MLSFSSCKKEGETIQEVRLHTDSELTVLLGETAQIKILVDPAGTAFTCTSKDPSIAKVEAQTGLVTGVAPGETVVTTKAGDQLEETKITVVDLKNATGIGKKDQDIPHFIYMPAKSDDINVDNAERIKGIMVAAGWEYDEELNKEVAGRALIFDSPLEGDRERYYFSRIYYFFSSKTSDGSTVKPSLQLVYPYSFPSDPFASKNRATVEQEGGIVHLLKDLYGFTVRANFIEFGGENAWAGWNYEAVEGAMLTVFMLSHRLTEADVPSQPNLVGRYQLIVRLSYMQ